MPIHTNVFRPFPHGEKYQYRNSVFESWKTGTHDMAENSEVSLCTHHTRVRGAWSGGGPWRMDRDVVQHTGAMANTSKVNGLVIVNAPTTSWIGGPQARSIPSETELEALGTTAIAKTAPTAPYFNLATSLSELARDGVPNLPGKEARDFTNKAKASGSEYLNVEFGWKPFVSDLQKFARTVKNSSSVLGAYKRDSGHWIKRGFHFEPDMDQAVRPVTVTCLPNQIGFAQGEEYVRVSRNSWFECYYQYFVPVGGGLLDEFAKYSSYASKLLGVNPSPSTVYDASPWSWALDWFTNTGDVLQAVSALNTDGLVLRQAYIMCHVSKISVVGGMIPTVGGVRKQRTQETKLRLPASPYGFGVDFGSLSNRQVSIIAALGISRW